VIDPCLLFMHTWDCVSRPQHGVSGVPVLELDNAFVAHIATGRVVNGIWIFCV